MFMDFAGDTASNAGTLALLNSYEVTQNLPIALKTAAASTNAGLFRILLMPIDCFKTTMQVRCQSGHFTMPSCKR